MPASPREEIKNRNSEEYNILKIQLEGIIEELEGHFEAVGAVWFAGQGQGRRGEQLMMSSP